MGGGGGRKRPSWRGASSATSSARRLLLLLRPAATRSSRAGLRVRLARGVCDELRNPAQEHGLLPAKRGVHRPPKSVAAAVAHQLNLKGERTQQTLSERIH